MVDQTNSLLCHGLGYVACGLVLCTFTMTSMRWLRMAAIASNICFVAYAGLMQLWPILMLHAILLPLNVVRLLQLEAARRRDAGCPDIPVAMLRPLAEPANSRRGLALCPPLPGQPARGRRRHAGGTALRQVHPRPPQHP